MANSTLTRSSTSIAVTRERPLSFDLTLSPTSEGEPIDLLSVTVEASIAWRGYLAPGQINRSTTPWTVVWTAKQLENLPVTPAPELLITLTEQDGSVHDIIVPVATQVVPDYSARQIVGAS